MRPGNFNRVTPGDSFGPMGADMSITERIVDETKKAMKSGDKRRLSVLRMVRSRIQEAEVAARAKHGPDHHLDDEAVRQVIAGYAKQRRDSIDSYRSAGREEMAAEEEAELKIVQEYLPAQLDDDAIRALVQEAIAETGADSPKAMGQVMKAVMPKLKGAADGKAVNRIVREELGG